MTNNEQNITMSVIISRGILAEELASTTTTMYKPGNTVEQNKEEAAKIAKFLRDFADEWEQDTNQDLLS